MTVMPFDFPRAILFDWDNTLVDTWPTIGAALNATFRQMGLPEWSMAEVRTRVGKSLRDSFPGYFGEDWERARDIFYAEIRARHLTDLTLLDGGAEIVAQVAGIPDLFCAVVSNKDGVLLRAEVAHLGWQGLFDAVVGAGDAARDKPHPDVIAHTLPADVPPHPDVWFVGDSPIDMECAHKSGLTGVLIGAAAPGEGGADPWPPHRRYRSLTDLGAALKAQSNGSG